MTDVVLFIVCIAVAALILAVVVKRVADEISSAVGEHDKIPIEELEEGYDPDDGLDPDNEIIESPDYFLD